jgi:energy-coupling factor transporter ATP-binding protein EcfA2
LNRFPVLERLIVRDYRLYPGTPQVSGIDFPFQDGISLLAGINGLGKTTLINLIFRLLVGPFDLPKDAGAGRFGSAAKANVVPWTGRTSFFPQRVADKAQNATAELMFRVGDRQFRVKRAMSSLRLLECRCDGDQLAITNDEAAYHGALCAAADAGQFVDFLTSVKYLTFFNEERRDILWDEQAQRQFFRILFTRPDEARQWIDIEQQISSADSRARNISASVYQMEQDLKDGESLLINNAGVDARLAAEQALLDADLRRRQELEGRAEDLEAELRVLRRDLERSKLAEDEIRRSAEEIRFNRLGALFPSMTETAQYILTQLYADGRCLACEQHSPAAQKKLEDALEAKLCVVCRSDLRASPRALDMPTEAVSDEAIRDIQDRLNVATRQREVLADEESVRASEWRQVLKDLADVTAAANTRAKDVEALRSQLPPDPEDLAKLRSNIKDMREREATEKRKRQGAEAIYERLLGQVSSRIETATGRVSTIFQQLIERFLEERCSLTFKTISDRPSQSGRFFQYPSLRFEMTAAAFEGEQIRSSPDDVSESQREFIDLAFRMALAEAAATDGALSMVIETPEASLDAIFMSRAAEMLRTFARPPRSIVVTSNLTSSVMIPALMGVSTTDLREIERRRTRVLNLLEIAAPNAALRHHKHQYTEFLEAGLKGHNA